MSYILCFLLILTNSKVYTVDKLAIEKLTLKKNDQIIFNNSNLDLFIHVQSHYFYGTLTVNILNISSKRTTKFQLTQGDTLRFTRSIITISYTGSTKLCSFQIWYLSSNKCQENMIYNSGFSKSTLNLNGLYKYSNACYFFDLSDNPKISSTNPPFNLIVSLLYVVNNSFYEQLIDSSLNNFPVSKSFVFNANYQFDEINYRFSVTTKSEFFDFTQKDSIFKTCVLDSCQEAKLVIPSFDSNRSLKWWIWFLLSTFVVIMLGIVIMITIFPKKPEESLLNAAKPLISVA